MTKLTNQKIIVQLMGLTMLLMQKILKDFGGFLDGVNMLRTGHVVATVKVAVHRYHYFLGLTWGGAPDSNYIPCEDVGKY